QRATPPQRRESVARLAVAVAVLVPRRTRRPAVDTAMLVAGENNRPPEQRVLAVQRGRVERCARGLQRAELDAADGGDARVALAVRLRANDGGVRGGRPMRPDPALADAGEEAGDVVGYGRAAGRKQEMHAAEERIVEHDG